MCCVSVCLFVCVLVCVLVCWSCLFPLAWYGLSWFVCVFRWVGFVVMCVRVVVWL